MESVQEAVKTNKPVTLKRIKGQWGPASKRKRVREEPVTENNQQSDPTFTISSVRSLAEEGSKESTTTAAVGPRSVSSSDGDVVHSDANDESHSTNCDD